MQMSEEAFADYAIKLEKDDFEDDIRNLSSTLHQLVKAREDTINKLRISADSVSYTHLTLPTNREV